MKSHAPTVLYILSLHDALPISSLTGALFVLDEPTVGLHPADIPPLLGAMRELAARAEERRSEEHTTELQSRRELVCRRQLEKKKENIARVDFIHKSRFAKAFFSV